MNGAVLPLVPSIPMVKMIGGAPPRATIQSRLLRRTHELCYATTSDTFQLLQKTSISEVMRSKGCLIRKHSNGVVLPGQCTTQPIIYNSD